ncbi:MAG: hypothetical protein ACK5NT_06135 [Pyrinomonadaceae bacterium]
MKLAAASQALIERFLKENQIETDVPLKDVKIYARGGATVLTRILMVEGITLGNCVYLNPRFVTRKNDDLLRVSKTLIFHEFVHVWQYRKFGFFGFIKIYVRDFLRRFRAKRQWNFQSWFEAYSEIPFEIEARDLTKQFLSWHRQLK